ncbi:nuclease [Aggregicoccus sp. 17bor-14]|uniref:UvrB/UvrC motif-containing protein n=1 Tax=Myxococcaceae TaxID=31 RepID=UPI00129C69D4|nr:MULTISPECIES: UvrB/UvrC motif-containing protein [Myxococcaceae]MBF5043212.1 UvrB/UvrC motif-containing protein [Simulacricoccus sp. 17bor-14]MRI88969.1 nuclease [Aggregicoccus sp. 17bor-14]
MNPRIEQLRAEVRASAKNRPGTYRMLGPSGEVLYVGKSVHVRTRLLSYFRAERGEKAAEIIGHAHELKWEYAPSEFAALLQEFRHIKRWRPVYNVEHKGDRSYCFIKLTREAVPRLVVVRQVLSDGAHYFGPFRGRSGAEDAVRALSDLLELRDCGAEVKMRLADQLPLFAGREDPRCIRGQVHRCLAPCAGGCTRAEYGTRVDLARRFFLGEVQGPLEQLRERIRAAASRLQFEYAAELRDRAEHLEWVQAEAEEVSRTIESLSFLYTVPGCSGTGEDDFVYVIRRGSVRAELPAPRSPRDRRALADQARLLFAQPETHALGLRAHEVQEVLLIARWFRLHPEELARTEAVESPAPTGAAQPVAS